MAFPLQILYFALPVFALIGIFVAYFIGRKFAFVFQFFKFAIVGVANTAVDFGVLNFLMWLTKTYGGTMIVALNSISFLVAVIHSYFWNKFWTFKTREKTKTGKEFLQFLVVSIVGILINGAIVYIITTWISPLTGEEVWANIAKLVATVVSLAWNFIGYKFIVFKKKDGRIGNIQKI